MSVDRLNSLLRAAAEAQRVGQRDRAAQLFGEAIDVAPTHPGALNALGMHALGQGDHAAAATYFARAADADPAAAPLWMNLASAHRALGDDAAEQAALERALGIDQRDIMANVRLAELFDRRGDAERAAFRWSGVATVVQSIPNRAAALDQLLDRAMAAIAAHGAAAAVAIDDALAPARSTADAATLRRFDACVDAMFGRRRIFANAPHGVHYPFLPADEFFERRHFPWLETLEAATPVIIEELTALLADPEAGFAPYVTMPSGTPANIWSALDASTKWSALYLWRYGKRNDDVCARCPRTAALLESLPRADLPGRAPTVFFSLLQPGTRLPPHTGVSNVRAIVHLPLVVPDSCGFRVGGETREWRVGEAFVFDDTIEHEAWNESDRPRVVLIFDVWNPHLTEEERAMLGTLFGAMGTSLEAMGGVVD